MNPLKNPCIITEAISAEILATILREVIRVIPKEIL